MAAHLSDHIPISAAGSVSGNQPQILTYSQKATQTFLGGTPVQLTSGVLLAWDGTTLTEGILGIAPNAANNLATDGAGAPTPLNSVTGVKAAPTFGSVQFQASAVNFTPGAPFVDGRSLCEIANGDSIFIAQIDNASGANYTLLIGDIGKAYGLTIDTTGHWYVDRNKSTDGTNTAVTIIGQTVDGLIANARVLVKFQQYVWQLQ